MDVTPLTLGQKLSGTRSRCAWASAAWSALPNVYKLAQGGTAGGAGLNTKVGFDAPNKFDALAAHDAMLEVHGALNVVAASLMKMA